MSAKGAIMRDVSRFVLQPIVVQLLLDLGRIVGRGPFDLHLVDQCLGPRSNLDVVVLGRDLEGVESLEPDLAQLALGPLANEIIVVPQLRDEPLNAIG